MRFKKYLLTDSCFYYERKAKRSPHVIEVVDMDTGSVKKLKSGSVIRIIKEKR